MERKRSRGDRSFDREQNRTRQRDGQKTEKIEKAIVYRFLKPLKKAGQTKRLAPYLETDQTARVVQKLFSLLRKRFGVVEMYKDYSVYKHRNMELTVLPDGSSFCHQVFRKPLEDKGLPNSDPESLGTIKILAELNEKVKISNDLFPPAYVYDEILDAIDIVFPWSSNISIVLSTCLDTQWMNERSQEVRNVKNIGRSTNNQDRDHLWCEVYVRVDYDSDVDDVHKVVKYIHQIINEEHQ